MSNAEKNLAAIYSSGGKPTRDDLEAALLSVLQERNALLDVNKEVGLWMCRLVAARVEGDDEAILATLDEFMTKHARVEVIEAPEGRVH